MLAWIMNLGFAASASDAEVEVVRRISMLSAKHVRRAMRRR